MMNYFNNNDIEWFLHQKRHFIFDLNGLLLDDECLQLQATNEAFHHIGLSISQHQWRLDCVGHKPMEYLPKMLSMVDQSNIGENEVRQLISKKDEIYKQLVSEAGQSLIRPGVADLLNHLKKIKASISLCTSTTKEGVQAIFDNRNLGLAQFFGSIISGDEVQHSKPHPDIYLRSCQRAGHLPAASIAFEDSSVGVNAAFNANIDCIACPNDYTISQDFTKARLVLHNLLPSAQVIR